jgi:hypothetical protein
LRAYQLKSPRTKLSRHQVQDFLAQDAIDQVTSLAQDTPDLETSFALQLRTFTIRVNTTYFVKKIHNCFVFAYS